MMLAPAGWCDRVKMATTMLSSEPEPDFALVRGTNRSYLTRHPGPADIGLLVEVSNTTLASDRDDKHRIYARAGVPNYWIVNLVNRQIEVYEQPSGSSCSAIRIYKPGDGVPLVLDGNTIAMIPATDLLP